MIKFFYIFIVLLLTSCGNWKYVEIPYDKELYLEKLHVHFYDHNTCEWGCLVMDEGVYTLEDTLSLNVRRNSKGEIIKVKLVK
jgi:hypothetical protein